MITDSSINNLHDSFIVEQLCDTCAQLILAASVHINTLKHPILQSQISVVTSQNSPLHSEDRDINTFTTPFHELLQKWVVLVSVLMPICLNSGLKMLKPAHLLVVASLRLLKRSDYWKNNPDVNAFNCSCHIIVHTMMVTIMVQFLISSSFLCFIRFNFCLLLYFYYFHFFLFNSPNVSFTTFVGLTRWITPLVLALLHNANFLDALVLVRQARCLLKKL